MVAILDDPAVRALVPAYSVEQYHKLYDLDILPERCELIRGAVIEKMPQSPEHAFAIDVIRGHLERVLPAGFFIREEKPITLCDSEPEPDLAVIRGDKQDFRHRHPSTALLVVEVAITSEAVDRHKLDLYAEAAISEYWIVFPNLRIIERHSEPAGGVYRNVARVAFPELLDSLAIPGLRLPPPLLFVD